ncbi:ImuA family protein [Pseudoruegeria sp. HB172150]|uniref:ImuA family protein n=1 Tax=Pseudoruegeria sp. HB172150 TaxID=2721164 RepID=UPI0015568724|nr:hypothetical protein [Pseudoruegeria sp. HB172150]
MNHPLLSRQSQRDRPALSFLDELALPMARAHEVCGDARRTLASVVAARLEGPVLWIVPSWMPERLNPEAALHLFDPARLIFLEPVREEDVLWCMEEVLRAGVVPLVVADLPAVPGLTSVRRLHLAAETGAEEHGTHPLGLLLTPGDGGAPGVETRWQMCSDHGAGRRGWLLHRRRARTAPMKTWRVTRENGSFRAHAAAMAE